MTESAVIPAPDQVEGRLPRESMQPWIPDDVGDDGRGRTRMPGPYTTSLRRHTRGHACAGRCRPITVRYPNATQTDPRL